VATEVVLKTVKVLHLLSRVFDLYTVAQQAIILYRFITRSAFKLIQLLINANIYVISQSHVSNSMH